MPKGKRSNKISRTEGVLQLVTSSQVNRSIQQAPDYGDMTLSLLDANKDSWASPKVIDDVEYNLGANSSI